MVALHLALAGTLGVLLLPTDALAQTLSADEALELVATDWFEGIPAERIAPLSPAAVEALAALIGDPDELAAHAAAIELLGRAGGSDALAVIAGYPSSSAGGELLNGHAHRARLAVPLALGHRARTDDAALAELIERTRRAGLPAWRTERISTAEVGRIRWEICAASLGISGRPAALVELQRMREGLGAETQRSRRSLDEALRVHALQTGATEGGVR